MADEASTTGPGGSSELAQKIPPAPLQQTEAAPEPVILEEHIVKPAAAVVEPPATEKIAVHDALPPPAPEPKAAILPIPTPSTPPPIPILPPQPPPPTPALIPPAPAQIQTSSASRASAPPPPRPAPDQARGGDQFEKEREAISRILEEAKLPERHTPPGNPPQKKEEGKIDTKLGAAVEPTKPEGPRAAIASIPPTTLKEDRSAGSLASAIVAPLHTLKNDLQNIVREKKISLVKAAALESDKRGRSKILGGEVIRAHSHRVFRILFASALLLVLGAAAFFGVYVIMLERSGIPRDESANTILFAESTASFPLGNSSALDIKRFLASTRNNQTATLGSITRVVPTILRTNAEGISEEYPATLAEFLSALDVRVPADLLRALSGEFFFGIHTVDENAPLFVIPVLSYERAFAGMLAWEQTMNADLSPSFTPVPDQIFGAGGLPEKRRFEDIVMRNYDVRVLKDDTGTIQLYYSFPTQHMLIIGESPYSFTEVLGRLRAERKL